MSDEKQAPTFPFTHVVTDSDGCEMRMCELDGVMVPAFGEDKFRRIKDVAMREDDVLLCGYPKTGCHWTWEILRMIVAQSATLTQDGKGTSFMELVEEGVLEGQEGRRVMNTHVPYAYLPKEILEKKTKIVFTTRNPKDTATSFYNHHIALQGIYGYTGSFNAWFQLYQDGKVDYGSFTDYHQAWHDALRDHPSQPFYNVSFENMKEDLPREIRGLARFLEVDLDEVTVAAIAKAAGFDSMKTRYSSNGNAISGKLLRKGQVGDWENWLTVAQSRALDDVDRNLAHTMFKFRYSLT